MYDEWTRLALAQELTDAFGYGPWRTADLVARGTGRLDRRPGWLHALALEVAALARRRKPARSELVIVVQRFLREHAAAPADAVAPQILRRIRPAAATPLDHDWPIAEITSVEALAERLELSLGQLEWLADVRGLERTAQHERLRNYRYRWLPRRSGLPRLIEAPKLRLKEVQRWVLREILDHVPPHDAAYGFTRGRSVIDHAARHVGAAGVLRLDLRDFFASVPAGRVFGIFMTIGYPRPIAHVLTGLTTNTSAAMAWDPLEPVGDPALVGPRFQLGRRLASPHLPQGAPTSPALANLAALGLDRRLTGLAAAYGVNYSRYADDLTLSGPGLTRRSRYRVLAEHAAAIARDEGFTLNPAKTNLRTAARRQVVTGIVVNAHPNLARDDYDRLRATLHRLALDGPSAVHPPPPAGLDLRAHLNGRVAWAESLNPRRGAKLRRQFDAIDWDAGSAG